MEIKSLFLNSYRNYKTLDLSFLPSLNILLGKNAQGKTNILEAIYYSALSKSHRTSVDEELIKKEENEALLKLLFKRSGIENEIEIRFHRKKARQIFFNGQKIKVKELIGILNVVLFSPEDLFLIKGSPQMRRRFLDAEISQANPRYFKDLVTYTHLIAQRNALLKRIRENNEDISLLNLWDEQLVPLAARITKKRISSLYEIEKIASSYHSVLSDGKEKLSLIYEIKGADSPLVEEKLDLWYNEMISTSRKIDILRGFTSIGPHRDDISFFVNDLDLKAYGSQGQQRTGVLSVKLSELEYLKRETGEYPILLLDDVMSEIDEYRRYHLLSFIKERNIQTIITATEGAYFNEDFLDRVYDVIDGKISLR